MTEDNEISKTFCILPWIHAYVHPDSVVTPCCVSPKFHPFGNISKRPLKKIINNSKFKRFRQNFLDGKENPSCSTCFEIERSGGKSLRKIMNLSYSHHFNLASQTKKDGSIEDFKIRLLDPKLSNLCNFKCRSCDPNSSSSWFEEHQKLYSYKSKKKKVLNLIDNAPSFWEEMIEHIPHLETIFFAGGEPLIIEEQYKFLEKLIEKKRFDVQLTYNSNLSILSFKNYNFIELLKKFSKVKIQVSIDDIEKRGEYFRSGLKWDEFIQNFKLLKESLPKAEFMVNCTVNAFNIFRIPEIHSYLYRNNFINNKSFILHNLVYPEINRTQTLPFGLKEQVKKKNLEYIIELKEKHHDQDWSQFEKDLNSQIDFMFLEKNQAFTDELLETTFKLDKIRNENFRETYPELSEMQFTKNIFKRYLRKTRRKFLEKYTFIKNHWYGEMWRLIFIPIKAFKHLTKVK